MQYPNIAQPQYGFAPTMPSAPVMPPTSNMPLVGYASGGQVQAKNVQSKGRNGDSMLVHMTPNEVAGLQALAVQHGGSLTVNPQTGLPEANFLESILPTLLGAGLMLIPGVNALGAATIVGGVQTARTGDLGQGLLAGLGAFGGANIASGLQAAGASQAQTTSALTAESAKAAATDTATTAASNISTAAPAATSTVPTTTAAVPTIQPANYLSETGAGAGNVVGPSASIQPEYMPYTSEGIRGSATFTSADTGAGARIPSLYDRTYANLQQAGRGLSNIFDFGDTGTQARTEFGKHAGLKSIYAAAAPALLAPPPAAKEPKEEKSNYTGPYTPSERQVRYPGEDERRRTSEFMYFSPSNPVPYAKGGSVPQLESGGFVLTKKAIDGLGKGSNEKGQKVASAGLGAVPIRGKGTGTSDSIKTSIDGRMPARVSNGEAYVPKDKVKRGGGAKKFYTLMKKAERAAR